MMHVTLPYIVLSYLSSTTFYSTYIICFQTFLYKLPWNDLLIYYSVRFSAMIPTARCLAAKQAGFLKKSTQELGRLTRIGRFQPSSLVMTRLTSSALNTEALQTPTTPYKLLDFEDESTVAGCKTMADRAVGGYSTASLDWVPADPATNTPAHARFHGSISTRLPPNWRVERTGMSDGLLYELNGCMLIDGGKQDMQHFATKIADSGSLAGCSGT
jgi:hypothetical protein